MADAIFVMQGAREGQDSVSKLARDIVDLRCRLDHSEALNEEIDMEIKVLQTALRYLYRDMLQESLISAERCTRLMLSYAQDMRKMDSVSTLHPLETRKVCRQSQRRFRCQEAELQNLKRQLTKLESR